MMAMSSGGDQQRYDELCKDPQTNKPNPKSIGEADAILDAEKAGKIDPGSARRPDLALGEPNLDFHATRNGKPGYVDVKTPDPNYPRPLLDQAQDIATKSTLYDKDVTVLVDMKHVPSAQKQAFKNDLGTSGADLSKIEFVND